MSGTSWKCLGALALMAATAVPTLAAQPPTTYLPDPLVVARIQYWDCVTQTWKDPPLIVCVNQWVMFMAADAPGHAAPVTDRDTAQGDGEVDDVAVAYTWTWGDGTPNSSGRGVYHKWIAPGSYTVTLAADDPNWLKADDPPATTQKTVTVVVPEVFINNTGSAVPGYGGSYTVTASISGGLKGTFKFMLQNVSSEPGRCLNYGDETGPDLKFRDPQPGFFIEGDNKDVATTVEQVSSATVTVDCLDYGAYGKVRVEVGCCCDRTVVGTVAGGTEQFVRVPRDDDDNKIADGWQYNQGAALDDTDNVPVGDGIPGDGFSRYEEYRGFMVNGVHSRLDPNGAKDVFVRDGIGYGIGHFTQAKIGLVVRTVGANEYSPTGDRKVMNFRCGTAHLQNQALVDIAGRGYHADYLGTCSGGPGTPNTAGPIMIYDQHIRELTDPNHDRDTVDPGDGAALNTVIGHESAHNVSVPHHLDWGNAACIMRACNVNAPNSVYCDDDPNCKSKIKVH